MPPEIHPGLRWEVRLQVAALMGFCISATLLSLGLIGGIYLTAIKGELGGIFIAIVCGLVLAATSFTFYVAVILHRRWVRRASLVLSLAAPERRRFRLDMLRWRLFGMAGRINSAPPAPPLGPGEQMVVMSHNYKAWKRISSTGQDGARVYRDPAGSGLIVVVMDDDTVFWGFGHWKKVFSPVPGPHYS